MKAKLKNYEEIKDLEYGLIAEFLQEKGLFGDYLEIKNDPQSNDQYSYIELTTGLELFLPNDFIEEVIE